MKLCQDLTGLNLQALADVFNVQHFSAISKTVGRLNILMLEDKKVELQLKKLRECLVSAIKI
jgi:chromosomal replication initiation ATPase DnaA